MRRERITSEQFNEAAWNLGLPVRWKDVDADQTIDAKEISIEQTASTFDMPKGAERRMMALIREAATGRHLKVVRTPEYIATLDRRVAVLKGQGKKANPQTLRHALRDRDMAYRGWAEHTIDFRTLSAPEQKAAWILVNDVLPAVEAVHLAQLDPNNLRYLQQIAATGNFADYAHAYYSGGPWCQEIADAQCSSHTQFPKRVPNAGMWPPNYTDETVASIKDPSVLSPFVDRFLNDDGLQWRSLNANPALQPNLVRIAVGLRRAAAVDGIDPSLKKFLDLRASELESTSSPSPFFAGDEAWVNVKGGLDVTVGYYETDDSPRGLTAIMLAFVGPVDAHGEELGRRFQSLGPLIDKRIAAYFGDKYTPTDFSKGMPPLRFANEINAGDPRVKYVTAGYMLPNVPPFGREELNKKVFLLNNLVARLDGVMGPMAALVLDPSQRTVGHDDWRNFAIAHESVHSVGTKKVSKLGQPYGGSLEEARADQEGVASLLLAVDKGILSKAEADRACLAMVYTTLRGLSYGMSDFHGIGSFIEFSEHVQQGGLVETADGFYRANFADDAMYKAATNIARRIETLQIQSATDPDGATKAAEQWLADAKAKLPVRMREDYIPKLVQMPKDVFPWYHFQFSETVIADMKNRSSN